VIDIIFGDVFVVFARFLATDVVTLLCSRLSDIFLTTYQSPHSFEGMNAPGMPEEEENAPGHGTAAAGAQRVQQHTWCAAERADGGQTSRQCFSPV
jgi:hypothetical protein